MYIVEMPNNIFLFELMVPLSFSFSSVGWSGELPSFTCATITRCIYP